MTKREPLYPHVPKSRELLYPRPSKAIAELPVFTGKAYRVDIENWGIPRDATVATMVRFEQEELGNIYTISPELMTELGKYHYSDATWVTKTREDARNYLSEGMSDKDISEITSLSGGRIITENGMGGYLVLQPDARPRQSPTISQEKSPSAHPLDVFGLGKELEHLVPSWKVEVMELPVAKLVGEVGSISDKRKKITISLWPGATRKDALTILAHEYGHITPGTTKIKKGSEELAWEQGEEYAREWGVVDEYIAFGQQVAQNYERDVDFAFLAEPIRKWLDKRQLKHWEKWASQPLTISQRLSTHPIVLESSSIKKERIDKYSSSSIQVYFVDGSYVRDNIDPNFTQGGHHYVYDWIPNTEIWLDSSNRNEYQFILLHELRERNRMLGGLSYYFAHDNANTIEQQARNKPGTVHSLILHELAYPELRRR